VAWWISLAVVVVALVVLVIVAGIVVGSLRRFATVAQTVNTRLGDGQQRVQPRVANLQREAAVLQQKLLATQERAALIQARRGEHE
jgi:predicted PurR-regulated permease PerM